MVGARPVDARRDEAPPSPAESAPRQIRVTPLPAVEDPQAMGRGGTSLSAASSKHGGDGSAQPTGWCHGSTTSAPSGTAECAKWARRRREAVKDAPLRRERRLVHTGELLPLVPHSVGYQVSRSAAGAKSPYAKANSCSDEVGAPWQKRLCRVAGIYSPPVWHEVYG